MIKTSELFNQLAELLKYEPEPVFRKEIKMKKLISSYKKQIEEFDRQFVRLSEDIRENRKLEIEDESLYTDRKIIDAKRNQLYQITKDLEDL